MTTLRKKIVFLSSSLLDDRKLRYSGIIEKLSIDYDIELWSMSFGEASYQKLWEGVNVKLCSFPSYSPYPEYPHCFMRRICDYAWDYALSSPSRLSMIKHVRNKKINFLSILAQLIGKIIAISNLHEKYENFLERKLLKLSLSDETQERVEKTQPSVIISTGPNRYEEPLITAVAKKNKVPVICMIHSWDNISTKGRMNYKYDCYLVWSEDMKKQLLQYYPYTKNIPISIVGAPQFDLFFNERFHLSREEFFRKYSLSSKSPIIVYALGSPNFIPGEYKAPLAIAKSISRNGLGEAQLIVRPHPIHNQDEINQIFSQYGQKITVQNSGWTQKLGKKTYQGEEDIVEWVNTVRHADVIVNFSSTFAIEGILLNKPVINLDYDPDTQKKYEGLIHDVNHAWVHFKPLAESGALKLVRDDKEMLENIKKALKGTSPNIKNNQRVTKHVCGYVDGKSGPRVVAAIRELMETL